VHALGGDGDDYNNLLTARFDDSYNILTAPVAPI
jgi:hypothetical protein